MPRVCILTFKENPIAADLFTALSQDYEVYVNYTENTSLSFKQIWQRKRGLRWLWFNALFSYAAKLYGVGHRPQPAWDEIENNFPNSFIYTEDHNSEKNRAVLKSLAPDLGILIGTALIRPEVFRIPDLGMINLHQGNIPDYRGAPPAFWEHHNHEHDMYVTVHTVVEKLDAGSILEEDKFPISGHEHCAVSKFHANTLSAKMLRSAVNNIFQGIQGDKRDITGRVQTVPSLGILCIESIKLLKKNRMGKKH